MMKLTPIQWVSRNKLLTFFILISVGLFLSTTVLAVQKSKSKCLNLNDTIKTRDDDEINSSKSTINRMPLKSKDVNYYRLPRNVIPENYKLVLEPNLSKEALDTFRGVVTIRIKVLNSTNRIALHSNKLTIPSATLTNNQHENIRIASTDVSNSDNKEMVYFDVDNKLEAGKYYLIITFTGTMSNKLVGFYASTLKNKQTMVASKFQPTYARQAFPCFDEPDFKATYDITLLKPASYIALSNMNEISKTVDPETKLEKVSFATSVPMSTYLACFVVCDFDHKETEINAQGIGKNFILRSFAQKDQTHKIDFAQDIGKRVTEFYIDYYQVPFPLPKLDMIAIPDYVSGATEHWGLVTYRETSFLVDEATASSSNKISVANTIAHELAHMWFGNLVTMKWWDEVWLNEGFASYMQVKALNAIEPSWNMLDQFLIKTLHGVLKIDAKLSSHPIVQTVATPDQITAIFDSISYSKGSSVLRMLEGFIGAENFRQGVSDYLKKHEFGNTVTQDLLACLVPYFKTGNSDLNLTYIMDTWTRQMGYPVLTVSEDSEHNKFIVTQARFLQDPDAKYVDDSPFSYRWFVPITYKTNMAHSSKVKWLPDTAENLKISLTGDDKWLKLNNDQVGYYRVNYSPHMWAKLIEELKSGSTKLSISDRSNLLDDAFALAEAKQLSYDVALNLTQYLSVEEGYVNWETAWDVFSALSKKLFNTVAYNDLQIYVQSLIKTLYLKQSWNPSKIGVIDGLLRSTILNMATSFGLPEAQEKVRNMLSQWLENHGTSKAIEIETDLRNFVYYHGMKHATQEQWDRMWSIYLKEEDVQEQAKLRRALTAPSDTTILMKFLALAWDENNIRGQDYLTVLQYISANPSGTALVWDDVRTRWHELVERFTLNSRYLGNLIPGITASFNTELKLKELQTFFEDNPEAGAGEAARRRALETVRNNIKWANQHQRVVSQWLHNNK